MEAEQPDLARRDLAPAPRYMWQWSAYAVVCCDGAVCEHLSVDGNPSGLHFQNVTGKGSNNLRDRLGSALGNRLVEGNRERVLPVRSMPASRHQRARRV